MFSRRANPVISITGKRSLAETVGGETGADSFDGLAAVVRASTMRRPGDRGGKMHGAGGRMLGYDDSREPSEQPEGRPREPMDPKTPQRASPDLFYISLVILAFLLALPPASFNPLNSVYLGKRGTFSDKHTLAAADLGTKLVNARKRLP